MTGAELQTMREYCALSRQELAELSGVESRTVKYWESGKSGVPADVCDMVTRIKATIKKSVFDALSAIQEEKIHPSDVVLLRYRSKEDLHLYAKDMRGAPLGAHNAIVMHLGAEIEALGAPVRVVWMNPVDYEQWRSAHNAQDTQATRATWAGLQVDTQDMPHRGDQPPEHRADYTNPIRF